jgi:hypothetical protein
MIPDLVDMAGAPWPVLPPGIHPATFAEVKVAYATNAQRRDLYEGLLIGSAVLAKAGCTTIYLDGSYVTGKPIPGDYDVAWEPAGVIKALLDPVFFDFKKKRAAQKAKYRGEYWPVDRSASYTFLDFFQNDEATGEKKGILSIKLSATIFTQEAHNDS